MAWAQNKSVPHSSRLHCDEWAAAAHLPLAASLSLAAILYRFPPAQYTFYPICPIHQLTGLLCPGCGMTRALAELLHGHLAEAMRWNPLALLVVAGLIAWIFAAYRGKSAGWPRLPNFAIAALVVAVGVVTVIRNLP